MNDVKYKSMYNEAKQDQNRLTLGRVGCNFSNGSAPSCLTFYHCSQPVL